MRYECVVTDTTTGQQLQLHSDSLETLANAVRQGAHMFAFFEEERKYDEAAGQ